MRRGDGGAASFGRGRGAKCPAGLAPPLDAAVLADGGSSAVLALRLLAAVLAQSGSSAVLALRLLAAVLAESGSSAVLAVRLLAAVLTRRPFRNFAHVALTSRINNLLTSAFSLISDLAVRANWENLIWIGL